MLVRGLNADYACASRAEWVLVESWIRCVPTIIDQNLSGDP